MDKKDKKKLSDRAESLRLFDKILPIIVDGIEPKEIDVSMAITTNPVMVNKGFKKGDLVQHLGSGRQTIVKAAPGDFEYDSQMYLDANSGFEDHQGCFQWQYDYKVIKRAEEDMKVQKKAMGSYVKVNGNGAYTALGASNQYQFQWQVQGPTSQAPTTYTWSIGDRVVLPNTPENSTKYRDVSDNPFWGGRFGNTIGTIIEFDGSSLPVRVRWDSNIVNNYEPWSLKSLAEQQKEDMAKAKKVEKKPAPKPKVSFDSVILSEDKKTQILSALAQQDHTETIFEKWGFKNVFEKGTAISFIFFGPPGTGKTLMAEAIAGKYNQPLFLVGAAEIESSKPGEAERNIKRAFRIASGKEGKPSAEKDDEGKPKLLPKEKMVLLFDECDSLITNRKNVGIILASQINTLLSELERHEGIVIFTTNRLGSLDPAMERRITEKVEFEFPNKELREKIWLRMIPKEAPIEKDVEFKTLSEFPLAGGNIKNCVLNAARHAAYKGDKKIALASFVYAVEKEIEGMKSFQATKKYTGEVASNEGAMRQEIEKVDSGEVDITEA